MEEELGPPDEGQEPPNEVPIRSLYLDTPALYASPELLRQQVQGISLIIPDLVVHELEARAAKSPRAEAALRAVREAEKQKLVSVRRIRPRMHMRFPRLSPTDAAVLAHVYRERAQGAVLVTNDQALLRAAQQVSVVGLESGGALSWLQLFSTPFTSSPGLNESIDRLQIYILLGGVLGTVLALTFVLLAVLRGPIALKWMADHLGPLAFLSAFPIGLILYVFRVRARGSYGVFEIVFGMVAAMAGVSTIRAEPDRMFEGILAVGAGLYVIVRGLDNLQQGSTSLPFLRSAFRWAGVR